MNTVEITGAEKHFADVASIGALIGVFMSWLPTATALVTFLWVSVRLFETDTIRSLIKWIRRK